MFQSDLADSQIISSFETHRRKKTLTKAKMRLIYNNNKSVYVYNIAAVAM